MKNKLMRAVLPALIVCTVSIVGWASTDPTETPKAGATLAAASQTDAVNTYVRAMRTDLSRGKVKIINDVMKLTADESATFWPIYQDYESELFDLGDKRVELIRRFAVEQNSGKLSQEEATSIADG